MNCDTCLGNCGKNDGDKPLEILPLISGGFLNITQKCNLKCKYCFVVQQPMEMTYEVAKDAVDFYAKNAEETGDVPSLTYFGGEPLLRWDDIIVPLTDYIREKYGSKFGLSITTNGILLTKEKLEYMKANEISCLFSIDGNKKTQDLNRPFHNGRGSFDVLKDKIPMILEYYPNMTFRATVDHDNIQDMANNYQFAVDMGYNNVFMIPNIFSKWTDEEKKEMEVQLARIADIYMDLLRKGRSVDFSGFRDSFKQFSQINHAESRKDFRNQNLSRPAFGTCGLGGTKFASVGASGTLYSCQELTESPILGDKFSIGNIYDGTDDNKRLEVMKDFDPQLVARDDGISCEDCLMNRICKGACVINNYLANEDLNVMSSTLCIYYQLSMKESVRIMNIMAEEENELFKGVFRRN